VLIKPTYVLDGTKVRTILRIVRTLVKSSLHMYVRQLRIVRTLVPSSLHKLSHYYYKGFFLTLVQYAYVLLYANTILFDISSKQDQSNYRNVTTTISMSNNIAV